MSFFPRENGFWKQCSFLTINFAMKSGIFSSLALVASLTIFGVASGFKRANDKVHWRGQKAKPALKARDDVPLVEERTTNYRFLSSATKRK